jgi:predicted PurR-regulated permease PerM
MGENGEKNGDSVLKVVRLFIDNINESTKSTVKELDKLGDNMDDVKIKINTPPRNEELSVQIQKVEDKVDGVSTSSTTINNSIKSMITSVRVAATVMAFAIIIAAGITQCGKYIDGRSIKQEVDTYLETKQPKSEINIKTDS